MNTADLNNLYIRRLLTSMALAVWVLASPLVQADDSEEIVLSTSTIKVGDTPITLQKTQRADGTVCQNHIRKTELIAGLGKLCGKPATIKDGQTITACPHCIAFATRHKK